MLIIVNKWKIQNIDIIELKYLKLQQKLKTNLKTMLVRMSLS